MNLIKNGLEAMSDGGKLIVSAGKVNSSVLVEVTDTGAYGVHDAEAGTVRVYLNLGVGKDLENRFFR